MVYAVNILKTCHWCGQFSSGHLEHLQSDHKDHLKCHYKKTMKWQMQGFRFIYQTPCVQKHVRRLLPNVEGLTEMDLFTADRSCVSVSLGAFLSATWAIWSNKRESPSVPSTARFFFQVILTHLQLYSVTERGCTIVKGTALER